MDKIVRFVRMWKACAQDKITHRRIPIIDSHLTVWSNMSLSLSAAFKENRSGSRAFLDYKSVDSLC